MGVEKARIEAAFRYSLEGSPAIINHALRLLAERGEGSFTVTDSRTKIWMSKRTFDELNQALKEEKL